MFTVFPYTYILSGQLQSIVHSTFIEFAFTSSVANYNHNTYA